MVGEGPGPGPGARARCRGDPGASAPGLARCQLSDVVGGLADLREALRLSLDLGLGNETIRSYGNLGDWVWVAEGPARGLDVKRAGIEFVERRGLTLPVMWAKAETLWPLFDLGHWDELLRIAGGRDRVGPATEWGPGDRRRAHVHGIRVRVPRRAEPGPCARGGALPRAREIRDPQVLVPAVAVVSLIEHARGSRSTAVRLIEEIEEVTRDRPVFGPATCPRRSGCGGGRDPPGRSLLETGGHPPLATGIPC